MPTDAARYAGMSDPDRNPNFCRAWDFAPGIPRRHAVVPDAETRLADNLRQQRDEFLAQQGAELRAVAP